MLCGGHCCYPMFTGEETEAQRSEKHPGHPRPPNGQRSPSVLPNPLMLSCPSDPSEFSGGHSEMRVGRTEVSWSRLDPCSRLPHPILNLCSLYPLYLEGFGCSPGAQNKEALRRPPALPFPAAGEPRPALPCPVPVWTRNTQRRPLGFPSSPLLRFASLVL